MGSRTRARWPMIGAVLAAAFMATAKGGEPTARELIALAPVLDSADGRCRSLDVGGWLGGDEALAPKLRFRALYRAPDRFSMLITDAADGTPLAFGSGRKMVVYDPVGPTVYYSEDAVFTLEMTCTETGFKLGFDYRLNQGRKPHRILVDFRSVLEGIMPAVEGGVVADRVVRRNAGEFRFIRTLAGNKHSLTFDVDLTKACPYTAAAFRYDGKTFMCLDRLALDDAPGDGPFAFPAKRRLARALPVKDVTTTGDPAVNRNLSALLEQATVIRAVANRVGPPGAVDIPGLSGADWDRVRQNDRKYAKVLRDLIPTNLRVEARPGPQ